MPTTLTWTADGDTWDAAEYTWDDTVVTWDWNYGLDPTASRLFLIDAESRTYRVPAKD